MNLLILDEPTNHLDIDSKEALEGALADFDGTVITVSHDRYFIDKLASRIIALRPGEIFGRDFMDYPSENSGGVYTDFVRYKNEREEELLSAASGGVTDSLQTASVGKEQYLKAKKDLSDSRKEQKRIERMKAEAERLEAELEEIENELYGKAATDYMRAAELEELKNEKEERLLEIYEEIGV